MQLAYNNDMDAGFVGMLAGIGPNKVASRRALENLPFGRAVFASRATSDGDAASLPMSDTAALAANADLIASNSTIVTVTVTSIGADGDRADVVTATAAEVYATSHAATMAAIAAKIDAISGVASATVGGSGNRTITVVADAGKAVTVSAVTTAGASQATWAATYTTAAKLQGVSLHEQSIEMDENNEAVHAADSAFSALRSGSVMVRAEQACGPNDDVYVRLVQGASDEYPGQFRKDSDSGKAVLVSTASWAEDASADAVTTLNINLP